MVDGEQNREKLKSAEGTQYAHAASSKSEAKHYGYN